MSREITKGLVMKHARVAFKYQHSRGRAVGERFLGYQLFGKMEIEVGDKHGRILFTTETWSRGERLANTTKDTTNLRHLHFVFVWVFCAYISAFLSASVSPW
jgi:hypothetical protein